MHCLRWQSFGRPKKTLTTKMLSFGNTQKTGSLAKTKYRFCDGSCVWVALTLTLFVTPFCGKEKS